MKKIAALLGRLLTLAGLAAPLSLWGFGFWVDDLYYRSPSGSETQVYVTECYFDPMMGVTSITIPAEVEGEYYDYDYDETRRRVCTVIGIYDYSFSGWRELTNVTMPNSITIIGSCAFANCWGLTSVTIPDSVTTIGYAAFGGCRGLTSVTIGNNVTSIGDYAFSGCSGLTNVKLPATVTNVSINAFGGVTGGSITVYAPWSLWGVLESGLSSGTMVNVEFYGEEPNFDVVSFNVNGGDELAKSEKLYIDGRAIGAMPEPMRAGYAFSGWFTAAEGGTPVTADTVVTGDMTVYARWVESPFTFGGNAAWVSEGDGIWRSGRISESQTSSAAMFVVGPAEVSFKWKTSSRRDVDKLRFTIDADYASEISGVMDGWGEFSHVIKAEGEHVLRWEYSKDGSVSDGADCGWVKDIVVTSMDDDGFTATIGGKEVAVPEAWINSHSELIEALGGDAASALNATAANGRRSVAECYVLGIDPEDPDDDFKITSFEIVNGEPVFTVSHTEDGSGVSFEPRIRKLGKTNLGDQWQEVPEGGDPSFRFFTVTVDLP